jgi:GPI ethanolamine phosphate transferase 3 subunit O
MNLHNGILLLVWVFFIHLTGIYLFTSGFLLTRLALTETSFCPGGTCTLEPTHKRVVMLIIDSLRFDFLTDNPPNPPSPYYHNILTLPRELTKKYPTKSFLFNSFSDPPTATLQRLKGITTGSLPTFVDIGSNFGGSSIAEDSLINQLILAGKTVIILLYLCEVSPAKSVHRVPSWATILG